MIRAVFDTNLLASAFVSSSTPPAQIVDAWRAGQIELFVSDHVLVELARTLQKPYFAARLGPRRVVRILDLLQRRATLTTITIQVTGVATHPEDDLVLATSVSAGADYLVTGDTKLQSLREFQGVTILSPREFLQLLGPTSS